jgi:prolyl oligopeptidase
MAYLVTTLMSTKIVTLCSLLTGSLLISAGLTYGAEPAPPTAPVKPVTEEFFGHKIVDPYRYMEDLKDPGVQAWMKAQADYTTAALSRIPQRQKLLARIHELNIAAVARITNVQVLPGDILFYEKTLASEDVSRLYLRRGMHGEEKLLLDPTRLNVAGGPPHVINFYSPSWEGAYVVAGISEGGSEQALIHIVDTATAKESPETIDRVPFAAIAWKDSRSFFYVRQQKMLPGMPAIEKELKSTNWLHTIGTSADQDAPVFGYDRSPLVHVEPIDFPFVGTDPGSSEAVGLLAHGVQNEATIYTAPLNLVSASGGIPWKKVVDTEDGITDLAVHGDELYLTSHKDAPRSMVLRTSLSHPDIKNAVVFAPQGSMAASAISCAFLIREARLRRSSCRSPAIFHLPEMTPVFRVS